MKDMNRTIADMSSVKCITAIVLVIGFVLLLVGCTGEQLPTYDYHEFWNSNGPYLMIIGYHNIQRELVIPTEHEGIPVRYIYERCFELNNYIQTLDIGGVTCIRKQAFADCIELRSVELRNVERIYEAAFNGCRSLEEVVFPESLNEIRGGAFQSCEKLKTVYFLGDPEIMCDYIFDQGVTICGSPGGTVEKYANDYGYKFVELVDIPDST